jgi:HTH-type transcriptional regulator/antitoxin HipB
MWMRVKGARGLGDALGAIRKDAGLTQVELAERLEVSRTTVLDMEKTRPAALQRLVDAFAMLGYDIVVVPRGARVVVEERHDAGAT